tara:strand:- start:479 stop:745 length:267 start_codon:yes stop_codon:yes gene_type:complete
MKLEEIQLFINENINPGLSTHGGFLLAKEFRSQTGELDIIMGGGCQGCAVSNETLKYAIDLTLKEQFQEIRKIQDVTQHSEGTNPYYS